MNYNSRTLEEQQQRSGSLKQDMWTKRSATFLKSASSAGGYQAVSGTNEQDLKHTDFETISPMQSSRSSRYSTATKPHHGNIRYRGDKRLIERGGDFHQSTGKIALRKKIKRRYFRALYGMDLFHSLVDAPTPRIIMILMGTYLSLVAVFAVIYFIISKTLDCNLGITNIIAACFFSLETTATIGYSTQDIFFDDCLLMLIVLSIHICLKLVADAVTIGVIYSKLSRPHARASTVIFSDKGVIRRIRGKLYFMFQLCELRKHQLVEAHVRVYCVRKEVDLASCFAEEEGSDSEDSESVETLNTLPDLAPRRSLHDEETGLLPGKSFSKMEYHTLPELPSDGLSGGWENRAQRPSYMQTCAMRLNHPNDEMGGMLLLMTPQVVVHEIDAGSPLMPPPVWYSNYPTGEFSRAFSEQPSPWQHQQPLGGEMGPDAASVSGLGVQEEGDCIRWRPPAYRGFIHHIPAHQLPYYHAAQEQHSPVGPVPYQGTGTGDPVQSWYYDAEALARIEFPSVTRRIDTDNITAGAPATTASGYGEYATAAATAGAIGAPTVASRSFYPTDNSASSSAVNQEPLSQLKEELLPQPLSMQVPHASSANLRDEEGRAVGDWSLQSAGLSGYADLLNPSPSGLRSASTSYLNLRAALHVDSPLSKPSSRQLSTASQSGKTPTWSPQQHTTPTPTVQITETTQPAAASKPAVNIPPSLRESSMEGRSSVYSSGSSVVAEELVGTAGAAEAAWLDTPVPRTAPPRASNASKHVPTQHTHPWSRPVPQPPLQQGQGPQLSTTAGLKVGGAGIDAGHHHHHHRHAPASAGVGATDSMYNSWQSEERHMVQRYMRDRQIEIIVIVEGVDAATGGNVQARHSYTSDELEWDKSFQCCVFKDPKDGCPTIDFSLFHELLNVPPDAPFAGVVHSSI